MANEWPTVRLGDYVDSNLGKMLDAQKNKGVPRPYLGNSNVRWGSFDINDLALMKFEEGEEERYGIRDGDLIVCEGGEPGRCAVWREQAPDMKIQKALHRIRPKDGLNNYYLFYWFMLAGRAGWLEPFFTGTTIKHLTGRALNELKVPLPPIKEQCAIAHILGTLDDKIELNRKQNETLEAMARALFKAWFVDFEPVRAKLEGRWQRGQSLPGLPAHLYDLFPDQFVESELGEIPEGWRVLAFGDVALQGKGTVSPTLQPEETFTHYSLPAFDAGQVPAIELGESIKSNKTPVPDGAVLVSKLNPHIPRIWLVGDAGSRAVCSTEFIVWTPKAPASSAFVYCLSSSFEFNSAMQQLVTGTSNSHQRVKPEQLREIRVIAAEGEVVEAFARMAKSPMDQILQNSQQSRSLAQLRDTLLPKLISGELRVSSIKQDALP